MQLYLRLAGYHGRIISVKQHHHSEDLMVRASEIRRAVLSRFAPGISALLGSTLVAIAVAEPNGLRWAGIGVAAIECVMMSLGYALALVSLRRALPPEARLTGWRSLSAAALALVSLGVLSAYTQGASTATITVLSVAAGVASGFLTWVPTLWRPRPPVRTLDELEAEADARLVLLNAGDLTQTAPRPMPDNTPVPPREKSRFTFRRRVA
jgi:hypothetical protein